MNMSSLDWGIVAGLFLVIAGVAIYTKRYTRSVADFLSGSRCGKRYLLTMAEGMSAMSAVAFVAYFEQNYHAGFGAMWWRLLMIPVAVVIPMLGWVVYRFRETRALTMAQFLEIRYSRKFRVFAGLLCWFSGLLNYGIFPGVTAKLMIHFCGLPESFALAGLMVPTFPVVMFIILGFGVTLTLAGGQIAVMVTDFLQGQFLQLSLVAILIFFLLHFGWDDVVEGLKAAPEGASRINPFKQGRVSDFNMWFFMMQGALTFYGYMAWQGGQGYYSAAKNPHEAKMGRILSGFRAISSPLLIGIVSVVAFAVFHGPAFQTEAAIIEGKIASIADPQVQVQMRVPMMLTHYLPAGMVGILAAVFLAAAISTDDSYLHSWGSIFIQDVIMPFRKKKMSAREHLKWLRISIFGTAIFAFIFSMVFPLRDFILMYWRITGSIFLGGAGAVIIGGLYWKHGTTAGAWWAMILGSILSLGGTLLSSFWHAVPFLAEWSPKCPLNGMQMSFAASGIAVLIYVIVSLASRQSAFNMDRMLHRGEYAIEGEHVDFKRKRNLFNRLTGITREFSLSDKIIAYIFQGQSFLLMSAFAIGTVLNLIRVRSDDSWLTWWGAFIIFNTVLSVIVAVWFLFGGFMNLRDLFRDLRTVRLDDADDGTVVGHHSLADEKLGVVSRGEDPEESGGEKT
jgi:solute:Na+ symporter, SSS family